MTRIHCAHELHRVGLHDYLRHEAAVYDKLHLIQGIYIPLQLGGIDLAHPYSYDGIAFLEHTMLLSQSGQSLDLAPNLSRFQIESLLRVYQRYIHDMSCMETRLRRIGRTIRKAKIWCFSTLKELKLSSHVQSWV